jgi:ankyrin repeat protein
MKSHLIAIVAAVLVVGCGGPPKDIWEAAVQGDIEAVKRHLATGTDVDVKGGWMVVTPLHMAAANGHKEIAELLIAKGADVNAKAEDDETPLDATIEFRHPEISDLLRKHGGKTSEELKAEGK